MTRTDRLEDGDYNYAKVYRKLISAKNNHRTIEEIVAELQNELSPVKEESLLVHAMRLIIELDTKATSPLYEHLQSPMRQTLYLIDVYYSIEVREGMEEMDAERWERIAKLLDEIEMAYFIHAGFPNNGDVFHDERDEQVEVALGTFIEYFDNAVLSYEEQTRDRIVRYFKPYDEVIQSRYGFSVDEALKFISHTRRLNNDKLNDIVHTYAETCSYYATHPKAWRELTKKFEERGVTDPHEWWYQPELSGLLKTMTTNPGEVHVHTKDELLNVEIEPASLEKIVDFFTYDKETLKGQIVYYAGKHHSESHPLIKMGERYVCPINKFLLEGMYYRIDEALQKDKTIGQKYKQTKDKELEKKVEEMFRQFFPEKTKIFSNYSVDGVAENDLLVIFGNASIVVETKDCGFREPFRDPLKAYPRIKKDFSSAVQLGYEQCKRVEDVLLSGRDVEIQDADKKGKVLYRLKSKSIGEVWSIVVTDVKYGMIQTNLGSLLKKEDDSLYPWAVCVDDIESMFLLMRKVLKGIAPARFIEFLDYRERLQEHVYCFDELEICGWYLNDREQFKAYADADAMVSTTPNMGTIFDAYYHVGLGFKDEFDIEYKKYYTLPDYPRSFEMNVITGEDMNTK